jgi:hypothetical protein
MIWREILLQLLNYSGDEGDEHKWSIPSAVSTEAHKEITVRQILHHLGTLPSEEALESKVREFFANRSALALSYAQHSADDVDLSLRGLESDDRADLLARFRFSTYIVEGQRIRPLTAEELQSQVSAFLDLRPDGYALHHKTKRLAILEFTRAIDSSDDWEEKKDSEKRNRYAPVLDFFNSLQEREGWTMTQFNFTVGVRGSISNVDRTEPLSFTSTLKALGITSRTNIDRVRKLVANRTLKHMILCSV